MAYPRPESLGSHGERRVIGILTVSNLLGGGIGLAGLWMLTGLLGFGDQLFSPSGVLRSALAMTGGVVGVIVTFRWTGISTWDRIVLWIGYQIRRSRGKTLLLPSVAAPVSTNLRGIAPVLRDGKIIAEVYDPGEDDLLIGKGAQ